VTDPLIARAYGCLLGGLVGDAMGTPTENLEPSEIAARYGWVDDFEGSGTDDSLVRDLLCQALIETHGYATADDWAAQFVTQRERIFGDKRDKFFISVLHMVQKLSYGYLPTLVSQGNMPSSSSAMAISPVGIVNALNPRAAAQQAQELASLIHTGVVGFCQDAAAAVAAAVAAALHPAATIDTVLGAATAYLRPTSGAELRQLILSAVQLARASDDYQTFRDAFHRQFRQAITCDSRETVPAAFALCCLARGDPRRAIEYAANFGRDADTIATMAGGICGALAGADGFPSGWIEKVTENSERSQHELSGRLVSIARAKARSETSAWQALLPQPDGDQIIPQH
jgi:ADP-ribosylglycohydrolase